jgi:hypothetical protein
MRVDGDPFIAANLIAADLVPGVANRWAYFGYTYFYVNERVAYPCYLCGACDGVPDDPACTDYHVVQNFDRRSAMSYPLQRGYETVDEQADVYSDGGARVDVPEVSDVDVNFYPYGVEARAVDPYYTSLWNDYWWHDPFYWYGPYYPYYGPGWSIGIGFGWGWGWWGGYYCSGWYDPCYWGYDPWYGSYPPSSYRPPVKFKEVADTGGASSLTKNRAVAAKYDGSLRIASKEVQESLARPAQSSLRSKTGLARGSFPSSARGKSAIDAGRASRGKTTIGKPGFGGPPRVKSSARAQPSRRGIANAPRGGGGYKSRAVKPGTRSSAPRNGARMSAPPSSPRAKSGSSYRAPSSRGGTARGTMPRSSGSGSRSKGR